MKFSNLNLLEKLNIFLNNTKIKTNEDSIAHLQFHKDYTENLDLQGIQKDKKLDDEIVRFEELKHL